MNLLRRKPKAASNNIEGNFLSSIRLEDERKYVRHNTNLLCNIHNFKGMRCQPPLRAYLKNISQGGALLDINTIMATPGDHIYLVLDNYPYRIGAAVVEVTNRGFHLKFLKVLDPNVTERIAQGLPYNGVLKPSSKKVSA